MTIRLGAEGEYGTRLVRYLENHLDKSIRIRHFTDPGQWDNDIAADDIIILSSTFIKGTEDMGSELFEGENTIWISDNEEGDDYCRFHPPEELKSIIEKKTGLKENIIHQDGSRHKVCAVFSPFPDEKASRLIRSYMHEGDLYLGMEDINTGWTNKSENNNSHTGDLCYYIHLRDHELVSRIKELSEDCDDCRFLPSAPAVLPLLELTGEDYQWMFEQLWTDGEIENVFVSIGFGILCRKDMLPHFDRLILLSSRHDEDRQACCEYIYQYLKAGYGKFSGYCDIVDREILDEECL